MINPQPGDILLYSTGYGDFEEPVSFRRITNYPWAEGMVINIPPEPIFPGALIKFDLRKCRLY